jgi:hypothetical protein
MHLSHKYAVEHELDSMYAALAEKVEGLLKEEGTIDEVEADVKKFGLPRYPEGSYDKAVNCLVHADAFLANDLGIRLATDRRAAAQKCADRLLVNTRSHMRLCGHGDHAHWAGKRIMLVHKWLSETGSLSHVIEKELRDYAKKLEWAHKLFNPEIKYWQYHRQYLLVE